MKRNRSAVPPVSTIYMALSGQWSKKWSEQQRRYSYLPNVEQAIAELCELSQQEDGVPAIVYRNSDGQPEHLRLYGSEFYVGAYPSTHGGGYILAYMEPIDLRAHEALASGVLLLQGSSYQLVLELRAIPQDGDNCWMWINQEWEELELYKQAFLARAGQTQDAVTARHRNYLNKIDSLIEKTQQLDQEKQKHLSTILYVDFSSTGEQRNVINDIYEFRLLRPVQMVQERYQLRIKKVPDLCGTVLSIVGKDLKIQFPNKIDKTRIPRSGELEVVPNSVIFDVQRKAVKVLHNGQARNPHLLPILVDHHYQPYRVAKHHHAGLNAEQLAAFQHALTVPDLLLVLGPPGTGKTYTITEIVRHHCSLTKKRVLVTAHTHKAVDNVLSRLADPLEVVRLGQETRVGPEARHLLIDVKAKEMQADILKRTEMKAQRFACFLDNPQQIIDWYNELTQLILQIEKSEQEQRNLYQQEQSITRRVAVLYQDELDHIQDQLYTYEQQLAVLKKKIAKWERIWRNVLSKMDLPLIGRFFTWCFWRAEERLVQARNNYEETENRYVSTDRACESLQVRMQQALWADTEYRMVTDAKQKIEQSLEHSRQRAATVVGMLRGTVEQLLHGVPPTDTLTADILRQFTGWYNRRYSFLVRRARLLRDWRKALEQREEQLRPELIRYADVIGATCIGIATAKWIEDIEFDLAIVDEAGQICLPDLLVPLARANRAVLVGDHRQLPPFVGDEVKVYLDSLLDEEEEMGDGTIADLLRRSTFEILFEYADRHRRLVRLTRQFRMPQAVAEFVSKHFYNGRLYTEHPDKVFNAPHDDPLFRCPLALIDTSGIAKRQGEQQSRQAVEEWAAPGYTNTIEAVLIATIAAFYERANENWVIIVPYRVQVQCIIEKLQSSLGGSVAHLAYRVSTVDSFQGSECSKVIYGFTRSNLHGEIGFLKELRRINVAITRAKEQLVVVGDFETLTNATDEGFRSLAHSLYHHTYQYGEVLSHEECQSRLSVVSGRI
jgi:hypothetical protein